MEELEIELLEKVTKGTLSKNDMFGQFQTEENRKGNEVSMCGIQSRKFTTHILVKDLDTLNGNY